MDNPQVTVLLPVYNGEKYLDDAVESILQQTFSEFEFLIIDDGSTDNTFQILEKYKSDPRVRVIHQENKGLVATLNRGLQEATAPLIARMDADDIALPNRLEKQISVMQADDKLAVLGGAVHVISDSGEHIKDIVYPTVSTGDSSAILKRCPVAHPTVLLRKDVIVSLGGYRKAFTHAEDYDLWIRVYEKGYRLDNLQDFILYYRETPTGVSNSHRGRQHLAGVVAVASYGIRAAGETEPFEADVPFSVDVLQKISDRFISPYTRAKAGLFFHECWQTKESDLKQIQEQHTKRRMFLSDDADALFLLRSMKFDMKKGRLFSGMRKFFRAFAVSGSFVVRYIGK